MVFSFELFADGDPLFGGAVVADDRTAPLESAVASLGALLAHNVVTPSTAERLTIVQFGARLVAPTPRDTRVIDVGSLLAKIGRTFVKEQIRVA